MDLIGKTMNTFKVRKENEILRKKLKIKNVVLK